MNRTARTITAALIAGAGILGTSATAHAGTYTLPNGTRISTSAPKHTVTSRPHATQMTDSTARTVTRTTLEQFRSTHPTQVKVRRGDTLWSIASKTRGSGHEWRTIARMNGVKGTTIYVGQVLRVR